MIKPTWREFFLVLIIIGCGFFVLEWVMAPRRAAQQRVQCITNLKRIGLALQMYAQENDDTYPRAAMSGNSNTRSRSTHWMDLILPYVKDQTVFHCPSDNENAAYAPHHEKNFGSYVINNAYFAPGDKFTPPAGASHEKIVSAWTVLLVTDGVADYQLAWRDVKSTPALTSVRPRRVGSAVERHGGMAALYADGHVKGNRAEFSLMEKRINGQRIFTGLTIENEGD